MSKARKAKRVVAVPTVTANDIPPLQYTEYKKQLWDLTYAAAGNFVEIGRTLQRAQGKMPPRQFTRLCREIGLEEDGAVHRRFIRTSEEAQRVYPDVDNWATGFKLAALAKFKLAFGSGPIVSASDIELLDDGPKKRRQKKGSSSVGAPKDRKPERAV